MSGPFIYIGTNTIREGKVDECKDMVRRIVELVEANEPRLIAFNFFLDEEGRRLTCVQLHPDSASMDRHMEVISEHLESAYDVLEATVSEQLYGPGGEAMVDDFRKWAPDAEFTVIPVHQAGFTRSTTAP